MEVGNCDGTKRQLPLWMLGVAAAAQITKSASEDGNRSSLGMNIVDKDDDSNLFRRKTRKTVSSKGDVDPSCSIITNALQRRARRRGKNESGRHKQNSSEKNASRLREESEEIEDGSLSTEGCEFKDFSQPQTVNNLAEESLTTAEEEITIEGEDSEIVFEFLEVNRPRKRSKNLTKRNMQDDIIRNNGKNKRKSAKRTIHNRRKTEGNAAGKSDELEVLSSGGKDNDSDAELTMDDLMHMAEVHIKADEEKGQKAAENYKSKAECLSTSISSEHENDSLKAKRSFWKVSTCTSTAPTSDHTEAGEDNTKSPDSHILLTANRTGDPKVDMLALFLGPLIRKPEKEEKKLDAVTEEMMFACKDDRQNKAHMVVENKVPVMKKKSSLKDKVAMFLG